MQDANLCKPFQEPQLGAKVTSWHMFLTAEGYTASPPITRLDVYLGSVKAPHFSWQPWCIWSHLQASSCSQSCWARGVFTSGYCLL